MPATPGKAKTAAKPKVKAASLHTLYPGPATRIASFDAVPVTVVHGNCLDALVGFIDGADVVVGCVAWVRNPVVLQHLAARPAMLVIQKESHWKGAEGSKPANRKVTSAYTLALHTGSQISPAHIPGRLLGDSQSELPRFACAGFGPATKFRPLLHDKFLVACAWRDTPTGGCSTRTPRGPARSTSPPWPPGRWRTRSSSARTNPPRRTWRNGRAS